MSNEGREIKSVQSIEDTDQMLADLEKMKVQYAKELESAGDALQFCVSHAARTKKGEDFYGEQLDRYLVAHARLKPSSRFPRWVEWLVGKEIAGVGLPKRLKDDIAKEIY